MNEALFGYGAIRTRQGGKSLMIFKSIDIVVELNKTLYICCDNPQRFINYLTENHPGVKYKVDTGGIEINGK